MHQFYLNKFTLKQEQKLKTSKQYGNFSCKYHISLFDTYRIGAAFLAGTFASLWVLAGVAKVLHLLREMW